MSKSSFGDENLSQFCTIQLVNMSKCEMLHFFFPDSHPLFMVYARAIF